MNNVPLPIDRVLGAVRARGDDAQVVGNGYLARCPVPNHGRGRGDQRPSLSINVGRNDCVLIHCHAGCDPKTVVAALGLGMADLKPTRSAKSQIVATYPYTDESGTLLFEVVRLEPKGFRQRRPDGKGGWIWNLNHVRRVPYRLPKVLAAIKRGETVYIVEGEKDVEALEAVGVVATTNPGGAGKWRKEFNEFFRDAHVVVIRDNDAPGALHSLRVVDGIRHITASLKPGHAAVGKDAHDHLAAGRSLDEFFAPASPATPERDDDAEPVADVVGVGTSSDHRPLTDTGNAERLHAYAGLDARYCHLWRKWLVWDGMRWRHDDDGQLMGHSKAVARRIRDEAHECPDAALAKKLYKWAHSSESRGKRGAMVELLTTEIGIPVRPDQLDRDSWLLNCANGTLDLRTGILRTHDRNDLITKRLPLDYEPTAECPLWEQFLARILPEATVQEFVQRAVGWSLTGDVSSQVLLFCYGSGANGKSTFLRVLLNLLGGDYAIQAPPEILIEKPQRGHPTELADLFGVRLAVSVEMGPGKKLDEVLVKQLTGGDLVRARRMREDFWQFEPTHHLWVAANHKPLIVGSDEAIWRRLMLIPFTVTIPEGERDGQLLGKLCAELPGILAWAVRGCQQWQALGLAPPEVVRAATQAYRDDMDVIGTFLTTECVVQAGATITAKALYDAFCTWAFDNGEEPYTQQVFGQALSERGFERRKRRGLKVYVGLTLRPGGPGGPPSPMTPDTPGSDFSAGSRKSSPWSPRRLAGRSPDDAAVRLAESELQRAVQSGNESDIRAARIALSAVLGDENAALVEAGLRVEQKGVADAR